MPKKDGSVQFEMVSLFIVAQALIRKRYWRRASVLLFWLSVRFRTIVLHTLSMIATIL